MRYKQSKGSMEEVCRINEEDDIIAFYKRLFKEVEPTIIDLVGTAGSGKTTFCQQFVDEEGKKVLSKIISTSRNSNAIQTDIVILEDTKNRLFLKARNRSDIMRDIVLVALNIDSEYKFDIRKDITDDSNKAGIKNNDDKKIKVNLDLLQGVYNLFGTTKLIQSFQRISKDLQLEFINEDNIQTYIRNNLENENLIKLLDDIIYSKLEIIDFYGLRHEFLIEKLNILEKTIMPVKIFNGYKRRVEEFHEKVSLRLLFQQAILVLKCDEKVKQSLPEKFRKGVVFRELQEHKNIKESCSITNIEKNCKIVLIPASTGGELVDNKFSEAINSIISSGSKESMVVITKIDKTSSYEEYTQNDYALFIESLKEQIVTSHNNFIGNIGETQSSYERHVSRDDKNTMAKKIFATLDNIYLSTITKDKNGNHDAELHKIIYKNRSNQEISVNDIEDIEMLDNWHSLVTNILENKNNDCDNNDGTNFIGFNNTKKEYRLSGRSFGNIKKIFSNYIKHIKYKAISIRYSFNIEMVLLLYIINVIFGTGDILNMN
ncbi:hypothetical protein [Clostridium psychrophilum]|uniref:hypothetical protein n=1 Tax=Clostridium psychrophilum TaxID=132926 RepID=UPI001C0E4BD1|nr:hypothetical protein [Clostridium psychrophilum]MBU3180704.1 hypothetical protein [Clostridium psychrophilum]